MRIALVSDNYPGRGHAGGIGTYSRVVARCLSRLGHDVHVFAGGGEGVDVDDGVTRHLVPPVGDGRAIGRMVERAAAQGGPFDVLEAPEFRRWGPWPSAAATSPVVSRFACTARRRSSDIAPRCGGTGRRTRSSR